MPKVNGKLENVTVNESDAASFSFKYSGKPKPAVKWFRDEVELVNDDSYEIIESADDEISLKIKSCRSSDHLGTYYAKLSNKAGNVSTNKAQLNINRKKPKSKCAHKRLSHFMYFFRSTTI